MDKKVGVDLAGVGGDTKLDECVYEGRSFLITKNTSKWLQFCRVKLTSEIPGTNEDCILTYIADKT